MTLADKLERSRALAILLSETKATEMALRIEIAEELSTRGEKRLDPGTHNFEIEGMKIKMKLGTNYSFDKEELELAIEDERLSDEELDLIRWKPDLKLGDYKKADFNLDNINEVLITKPSAPTLEIVLGET